MGHWIAAHLSMGVSDMKKFLINIAIFFAIVAAVDFSLGKAFYYLQAHVAGGRTGAEYYVCEKAAEDIIIMGSSRALHHYVPEVVSEQTGMSCFNAGQDGNGIVMQYGRWKMILKHHVPKILIYDIEPVFDFSRDDKTRYIDRLKPFAGDGDVREYIAGLFPLERYKILSCMYRYNYKFIEILSDCVRRSEPHKGYIPLYNHIRQELINKERNPEKRKLGHIDEVKMKCLANLIDEARLKGVQVVLVSSPYWKGYNDSDLGVIRQFAEEKGVPFMDYADSEIRNNPDWWADSMHLNDEGAHVFTSDLCEKLRDLI